MSPDPTRTRVESAGLAIAWARQRRLLVTTVLVVAVALVLFWIIQTLKTVLTPVFVAWVIAYALDPLIDRFERRGMSRTLAIIIVLTLITAAAVGFAFLIIPELIHQVVVFSGRLPNKIEEGRIAVTEWVQATFKVQLPATFDDVVTKFGTQLKNFFPRALGGATSIVQLVFTSTFTALAALANVVLIPLFAFYLLQNFDRHIAQVRRNIPRRLRPKIETIARDLDHTMAGFFRGQLTVMLIQGTIYSIALSLLGVPLGAAIGILTGLLCFIPYLGQFTGLSLALLMCVLDYHSGSGMQIFGVVCVYAGVNFLDGLVITPRVVGGQVGLPAVAVIFALLVFGKLLGFIGVLLAVPLAATLKVLFRHGVEYYKTTEFFLQGAAPESVVQTEAVGQMIPMEPISKTEPRVEEAPRPEGERGWGEGPADPEQPVPSPGPGRGPITIPVPGPEPHVPGPHHEPDEPVPSPGPYRRAPLTIPEEPVRPLPGPAPEIEPHVPSVPEPEPEDPDEGKKA